MLALLDGLSSCSLPDTSVLDLTYAATSAFVNWSASSWEHSRPGVDFEQSDADLEHPFLLHDWNRQAFGLLAVTTNALKTLLHA